MSGDELRHGRRSQYPFSMAHHWVIFLKAQRGLSPLGYMIYNLLLAHVNTSRADNLAWPTQAVLGQMLDTHPDTIGKLINKELRPLGLVDVTTHRYGDNNSRKRNVYTIHEIPDASFDGPASLSDWYRMYGQSSVNPQVSPETVSTPGPEPVYTPGPGWVSAPGPGATSKSEEREEAITTRNPPPPPSSGATSRRDEDEDLQSPLRGYDAQIQEPEPEGDGGGEVEVTPVDLLRAKALLGAVPWPSKRMALGAALRQKLLTRLSELSAGGWNEDDVNEYLCARIPDWKAVRRPAELVASLLTDSPTVLREAFTEAAKPREGGELWEAKREHDRLQALLRQQKALIDDCSGCDEMGWHVPVGGGTIEWHNHGKMGLNTQVNRAGRKLAQIEEAMAGDDPQVWEFAKN